MKYHVEFVEFDRYDNKMVTAIDMAGHRETYIVSPKDKKGTAFPGFEQITEGADFEASPWTSPKNGKHYLFAPDKSRPTSTRPPGRPSAPTTNEVGNVSLQTLVALLVETTESFLSALKQINEKSNG